MTKRIEWLDFAKGLTIFFVVLGHSLSSVDTTQSIHQVYFNSLMSIVFTFVMPCFFALSGYLYKPIHKIKNYFLMIRKKIIGLGIPYVIFSILYVFMQNISNSNVNYYHSYNDLFSIFSIPIAYLWFLYALFFIFVIVGLFDLMLSNNYVKFLLCLLLMLINALLPHLLWPGIQNAFNYIIYFYIGYCIKIYINKGKYFRFIYSKLTTFLLTLLFIIIYILSVQFNSYIFIGFPLRIIGVLLLFQFSFIIPHNNIFEYFRRLGTYTLIIYLFHGPAMSTLRAIGFKIITINSTNAIFFSLFLMVLIWHLSLFACYVSNKIKIIDFMFYPSKYIYSFISKLQNKNNTIIK